MKNIIRLLSVGVLSISLFAGCGSTTTTSSTTSTTTSTVDTVSSATMK